LDCRVANYGYCGYGTDQSYLRFQANVDDLAPIAILGHSTGNIIRNVNQRIMFRYMPVRASKWYDFKPRFVLGEAGGLEPVPLANVRFDQLEPLARAPGQQLRDFFVPGAPAGAVEMTFPWSLTIARAYRAFFHRYGTGMLGDRRPWLESYYHPGHASGAFELTEQILVEFSEAARSRSKQPVVLLFPTGVEVEHFQSTGEWFWKALGHALSKRTKVPVVHIGERLATELATERLCEIFVGPGCRGHYNARGNAHVAAIAYDAVRTLVPTSAH
jgi:RNase H-fold protein (predicted Holliday junction resolvase)